jgi:hypothetical protein
MNLFFWLLRNLAVPIVGPVFMLALVAPAYGWRVARAMIGSSVKDGQLFWCAIGLCAAAIYEAVVAVEQGGGKGAVLALGIVGFCVLAFICSVVVTMALLKARQDGSAIVVGDGQARFVAGTFSRGAIATSIVSTCLAASLFAALHIYLN